MAISNKLALALMAFAVFGPFVVVAAVDWATGRGLGHMFTSTCS